ncbi:hypothetical protein OSTOST_11410 [Ostertagia ostertagi]
MAEPDDTFLHCSNGKRSHAVGFARTVWTIRSSTTRRISARTAALATGRMPPEAATNGLEQPFLTTTFKVVITWILVGIQCVIVAVGVLQEWPSAGFSPHYLPSRYCTLVVWIAFVVLHMGTVNKALTMSFSFSLSASIPLLLLFFPKLYIIILHPEKNVRASYTTTKLIRSSTKSSSLAGGAAGAGITRTASVHVPAVTKPAPGLVDCSTQTEGTL